MSVPHILQIPEELVNSILARVLAYPERDWWPPDFDKYFGNARALLVTCRRFYRLTIPLLYRRLEITSGGQGYSPSATEKATRHLHRTLKEDSSLRRHCFDLRIHIGDLSRIPPPQSLAIDFVTWLTSTQRLKVAGGFNTSVIYSSDGSITPDIQDRDGTWGVVDAAVQNMPDLVDLSLTPSASGILSLPQTIKTVSAAKRLRTLSLSGVPRTKSGFPWDKITNLGTSPITTLILNNFRDDLCNLSHLLSLPASLRNFTFGPTMHYTYEHEPSLAKPLDLFISTLSIQASSLTTLSLPTILDPPTSPICLKDFVSLQDLTLAFSTTGCTPGTERYYLAPNLRVFTWKFHADPSSPETPLSILDFRETHATWLERLGKIAREEGVPLEKVRIEFNPDVTTTTGSSSFSSSSNPTSNLTSRTGTGVDMEAGLELLGLPANLLKGLRGQLLGWRLEFGFQESSEGLKMCQLSTIFSPQG